METPVVSVDDVSPRRQILKSAVAVVLKEAGFTSGKNSALETLTEMLQSIITEIAKSSKHMAELSGRTDPMIADVSLALTEMGFDLDSLQAYGKMQHSALLNPLELPHQPPIKILKVGEPKSRSFYIPEHLPPFPDPHTYVKTPASKAAEQEYKAIREKVCSQKRELERALTRFIARTGDIESVFPDDVNAFPLIANKPRSSPYLDAVCPKDHDMEDSKPPTEDQSRNKAVLPVENQAETSNKRAAEDAASDGDVALDSPYMREIKMPKVRVPAKKSLTVSTKISSASPNTYFNWQHSNG